MNSDGSTFARCGRHPSQFFTGFCSSCLVERLSSVESVERSLEPLSGHRSEIVEISAAVPGSERKHSDFRVRKTLLSLFELDDRNDVENKEHAAISNAEFLGNGYDCEIGASHDVNCSTNAQVGENLDLRTGILQSRIRTESRVSASSSAVGDVGIGAHVDPLEDESLKDNTVSFWLNSRFHQKGLRWRTRGSFKKNQMQERCLNGRSGDKQLESTPNFRHSSDWGLCRESSKATWEKPRHSWDGSMMSKALTCSFSCLEEPQDGSCRIRRRLPEEATIASLHRSTETNVDKADSVSLADEKPLYPDGSLGCPYGERHHRGHNVSNARRKKSHRWSKVWDWSITSPFREFAKKRERVLERSLSESWQESWKDNNMGTVESDSGVQSYGDGLNTVRTNQCLNRSINGINDLQNFWPDWRKKRECRLGRSRSVHYSSPGNIDSGLLRFYLTPLRTSRRSTKKGRMKTSRSFARGILGH